MLKSPLSPNKNRDFFDKLNPAILLDGGIIISFPIHGSPYFVIRRDA